MSPSRREDLPRFIEPMLATPGAAPTGTGWAMEVKWDGARTQLRFDGRAICLRSRRGRRCTDEFPEVEALGGTLGNRRVLLDGELICTGADGKPDFAALRSRLGRRPPRPPAGARRPVVMFMVFDVLHIDGRAVRELPYWRRRELLTELELDGPAWCTPPHFVDQKNELLIATAEQGLEGVVAKRLDAPYAQGRRSSAWVKQKHYRLERFLITGWSEREGALPEFFLARADDRGRLRPAGSACFGLDASRRALLIDALTQHELPRRHRPGSVRWAAPLIEVLADVHGPRNGAVRDAVLRDLTLPGQTSRKTDNTA